MLVRFRMANSKLVLFGLICFTLLICNCRSGQTDIASSAPFTETPTIPPTLTPSRTPIPTKTRLPTRTETVIPTLTLIPTKTQTLTRTPGPSPTPTLTLTSRIAYLQPGDVVFPTPEEHYNYFYVTPTPITIPESGSSNYSLKNWSYNNAIELIDLMDQYAYVMNFDGMGGFRPTFDKAQNSKIMAINEALIRFPGGRFEKDMLWQLAAANFIQDNAISNPWIIEQIEKSLNGTNGDLEVLKKLLVENRFWVCNIVQADNLFGDHQESFVIWVSSQDGYGCSGLVLAIRKNSFGRYEAITIVSRMRFDGASDDLRVEDLNQNGQPDVIYVSGRHSGTTCSFQINIYEWRDNEFQELTDGEIYTWGVCRHYLQIEQADAMGEKSIVVEGVDPRRSDYYQWTGKAYTVVEREIESDLGTVAVFLENMELEQTKVWLQYLYNSWEGTDDAEIYGSAIPDYAHFQLGVAYGLQGDILHAREEIQSVATTPFDPDHIALSNAAQEFLEHYQAPEDLYLACKAAKASLLDTLQPYIKQDDFNISENNALLMDVWGFQVSVPYFEWYLCDERDIFKYMLSNVKTHQGVEILEALKESGASIPDSYAVDLDADGNQDWVILADTAPFFDEPELDLWLLLNTGTGYTPYLLYAEDELEIVRAEIVKTADEGEALPLVQINDRLRVLDIKEKDGSKYINSVPDIWFDVDHFEINTDKDFQLVEVYSLPDEIHSGLFLRTYRWDAAGEKFQSFDLGTYTFFEEGNPEEAIALIEEQLARLEGLEDQVAFGADRYRYLLGLAYELIGEERAAVEIYWQLWLDFPGSPYAIMARAKLE